MSFAEENYLKALYHLIFEKEGQNEARTSELAKLLKVRPASVNDMLKKMKEKNLISNEKYGKIRLTNNGKKIAINIIRKHRLWETFLYEKLDFTWGEVHDVAEQLEHIKSSKLVMKLDKFLSYPRFDPHGDPIPNENGEIVKTNRVLLSSIKKGSFCRVVGVKDISSDFLTYIDDLNIRINSEIILEDIQEFDSTRLISFNDKKIRISKEVSESIYVIEL